MSGNSAEKLLHTVFPALLLRIHIFTAKLSKLLQFILLLRSKFLRGKHLHAHMLITTACTAKIRDALIAHTQDRTRLDSCRDLEISLAINRRYLDGIAHGSLHEGNRNLTNDICAAAFEKLMRFDENVNIEIAIAAAAYTSLTAAGYAHPLSMIDS